MKIGIMQPYFFPYVGYFSLIKYCDKFVFFDTPQYISHGWINRNRILKQNGTPSYFIVPIQKCKREIKIKDVKVNEREAWKEKIYGQLTVYKKKAPNYNSTLEFLHDIFEREYEESLSKLNITGIIEVCRYLGIGGTFDVFSEMNLDIDEVRAADEWALNITKALNGDVYVNPPGGLKFFNIKKYEAQNIKLEFLKSNLKHYVQRIGHFEPGLSIIDVMMFCSKREILEILDDFEIL